MQDALRGLHVLLQAAEAFRNGPASEWRMKPTMQRLEIPQQAAIHLPFSRTARRSVPAIS
jgi:hypothetical protein